MRVDERRVQWLRFGDLDEQSREQHRVHSRHDGEMQIGAFGGHRAAGIDGDDPRAAPGPARSIRWNSTGWHQAALDPDEDDEIGLVDVFVAVRHDVGAEGAALPRDR